MGDRVVHPRLRFIACGFGGLFRYLHGACARGGSVWEQRSPAHGHEREAMAKEKWIWRHCSFDDKELRAESPQVQLPNPRAGCHSAEPSSPQEERIGPG